MQESLVKDTKYAASLQENFYTIRENRFVLPVAITNKNKVQGIVHGVSGTGSTVYIEPQQVRAYDTPRVPAMTRLECLL